MSELVDIVDDADRVLRQATRAEMRRHNLLHRAVYVLVVSSRGELFVHRRTESKDVFPGHWDLTVGGVVAAGEDYRRAAERELAEELGIAPALQRLGPVRYQDVDTRLLGDVYLARHDGPVTLQREEIAAGAFVPLAQAEDLVTRERCCPDGVEVFRAYRARLTDG